jgi:hypothetical protein
MPARRGIAFAGPLLVLLVSFPLHAAAEDKPGHALCWRGKPECGSFVVTEMGALYRLDDYPFPVDVEPLVFSFDVGWMKNLDRRRAVGVTGYALANDDFTRFGIRPRYRRWLSQNTSLDISPGILLAGEDPDITYDPPGFVFGVTANAQDLIAVTLEAECARYRTYDVFTGESGAPTDWTVRGGAKLGSGLGVVGAAILGVALLVELSQLTD